jgi:hypothetical protein
LLAAYRIHGRDVILFDIFDQVGGYRRIHEDSIKNRATPRYFYSVLAVGG